MLYDGVVILKKILKLDFRITLLDQLTLSCDYSKSIYSVTGIDRSLAILKPPAIPHLYLRNSSSSDDNVEYASNEKKSKLTLSSEDSALVDRSLSDDSRKKIIAETAVSRRELLSLDDLINDASDRINNNPRTILGGKSNLRSSRSFDTVDNQSAQRQNKLTIHSDDSVLVDRSASVDNR